MLNEILRESWLKKRRPNTLHRVENFCIYVTIDHDTKEILEPRDRHRLFLLILLSHSCIDLLLELVAIRDFLHFNLLYLTCFPLLLDRLLHVFEPRNEFLLFSPYLPSQKSLEELTRSITPKPPLDAQDKLDNFILIRIVVASQEREL